MDSYLFGYETQIALGTWLTIQLAVTSAVVGFALTLLFYTLQSSQLRIIRYPITVLLALLRGLPELIVIFLIYFGSTYLLTELTNRYIEINPFFAGVTALSLMFAAYASQVLRGAFQAIPPGQKEAAVALALPRHRIFFTILLPQAWQHALPGLSNLWLVLLKDTALVSLISLADMMNKVQLAASSTSKPFNFYLTAALIYLVLTTLSEWLLNKIGKKQRLQVTV